ncbi:MAG: hypothetical protein FWD40_04000 [Treponema sp.]|nr:hypothetical protein [Treponema sp.]
MAAATKKNPDYPRGLTFEDVWAGLMEVRELQKETDRIVKENARQIGDLHNRFGELAEHLVAPNISMRFNEMGYHFGCYSSGGHKIYNDNGELLAEIDIFLENKETIMGVEVKTKPAVKDVEKHVKRLMILRQARDRINDKRIVQGAIAGAIFGNDAKKATADAGLFVIEQTGDTMKITVPDGFVPGQW